MRSIITLAAASFVAIWTSNAFAFTSTGTVESINPIRNELRLSNGDTYRLPTHVDLSSFKVGQRVHLSWGAQNPSVINIGKDQQGWHLDAMGIRPVSD